MADHHHHHKIAISPLACSYGSLVHVSPRVNSPPLPIEIIQKLPKAELHCHLDGGVRISTIIALAKEQGVSLPTFDPKELKELVTVGTDCPSLVEYLRGFDITLLVLQKSYAITRVFYEMAQDAVVDGITYLEVRFSPILHTREGLSLSGVMEAACEGLSMAEIAFPIKLTIIVCGMRQMDPSVSLDLAQVAWRYRHKGVGGFDLAGPEDGFSSKYHVAAFDLVRRKCVNCTLHSGEAAGWESVQDSIQYCGARRIGHGVRLRENKQLLQYVIDSGIAVEVCITSNLQTKAISSIEDHPIREYFDAGLTVVPCTDNPTVSGVTLSHEYDLIQRNFNFNVEEIVRLIDYGFSAAFLEVSFKNRLRAEALRKCVEILRMHDIDIAPIIKNRAYWDWIGVNITDLIIQSPNHWKPHVNPPITKELLQLLPKADLHCTLDGAVDIDFIYDELSKDHETLAWMKKWIHFEFHSKEELLRLLRREDHVATAKKVIKRAMQSKEQLERALENLYFHAGEDNVRYVEIVFRPKNFIHGGKLTQEQAVVTVIDHIKILNAQYRGRVKATLILYASSTTDDPTQFYHVAQLCVKYRESVVGFGVYGIDELPTSNIRYFSATFNYLKENHIKTSMFSGANGVDSIIAALGEGGARRISGAFSVHKYPRLMNYLASHNIPVEFGLTSRMVKHTQELSSFAHPLGLLMDNHIVVSLCSFRGILNHFTRTEELFCLTEQANLSIDKVVVLLSNPFRFNFQHFKERLRMYASMKQETERILEAHGFKFFFNLHYMPNN